MWILSMQNTRINNHNLNSFNSPALRCRIFCQMHSEAVFDLSNLIYHSHITYVYMLLTRLSPLRAQWAVRKHPDTLKQGKLQWSILLRLCCWSFQANRLSLKRSIKDCRIDVFHMLEHKHTRDVKNIQKLMRPYLCITLNKYMYSALL